MNVRYVLYVTLACVSINTLGNQGLRDLGRRYGANGYMNNLPLYYGDYQRKKCNSCSTKNKKIQPKRTKQMNLNQK